MQHYAPRMQRAIQATASRVQLTTGRKPCPAIAKTDPAAQSVFKEANND